MDFIEAVKIYCALSGLEYVEGLCDAGSYNPDEGTFSCKINGGYRVSILLNQKEEVYGFFPITTEGEATEEVKENARHSLLYALINKATAT